MPTLNREVILTATKQLDEHTHITGGSLEYSYFTDDAVVPHMRGGSVSEALPLDGMLPDDLAKVKAFMAVMVRLMGDEITQGTVKRASAVRRQARRAQETDATKDNNTRSAE